MKKAILMAATLLASHAQSAELSEIAACAALQNDIARLQCFDGMAASAGAAPIVTTTGGTGGEAGMWTTRTTINPMDDTTTIALALQADTGTNRWGAPITLIARCQSKEVDVYIDWGEYLGDDPTPTIRLDGGQASEQAWNISTDNTSTFNPNGKRFLARLAEASRLVAQITPYSESPRTAVFTLAGIEKAVEPIWAECGAPAVRTPSATRTVRIAAGSLLCESPEQHQAAMTAGNYRSPGCFALENENRTFEQVGEDDGLIQVRRFGQTHYTSSGGLE
ncbi:MAG: type VI secretion system-associated protein TagO [Gammaproteobacteria bacterium]|nr:type VI secretion system-associated protein TagO [Gammaproteobacteria bacterium]